MRSSVCVPSWFQTAIDRGLAIPPALALATAAGWGVEFDRSSPRDGEADDLARPACELVDRVLYLRFEVPPLSFDESVSGPNGEFSGQDEFATRLTMVLGSRYTLAPSGGTHGPAMGLELAAGYGEFSDGQGELLSAEFRAFSGWAWQATRSLSLGLELRAGGGVDRMALASTVGGDFTATGFYYLFQPELRASWAFAEAWRADLHVGWRYDHADLSGDDATVRLSSSGICVGIGLEWGLSMAPASLE